MRRVSACFVFLSLFSLVVVTSAAAQSTEHTLLRVRARKDDVRSSVLAWTRSPCARTASRARCCARPARRSRSTSRCSWTSSQAITRTCERRPPGRERFTQRMAKDGNPVALIGLADWPTILQDYIASPEALERASKKIFAQPGAGTTALDAIIETSRGLQKRDAARRVIVVLTTEGTDFSNPNYRHALDVLKESGAALYAVVLTEPGSNVAVTTEEGRNRAIVLADGSDASGGRLIHVISSMSFSGTLAGIAAAIEQQDQVVYSRPSALIPPDKIEVGVNRPGATARGTPAAEPSKPRAGQ